MVGGLSQWFETAPILFYNNGCLVFSANVIWLLCVTQFYSKIGFTRATQL